MRLANQPAKEPQGLMGKKAGDGYWNEW